MREEIREYLPKKDGPETSMDAICSFCDGHVAAMGSLQPPDAKMQFIGEFFPLLSSSLLSSLKNLSDFLLFPWLLEILITLPMFGSNVFVAKKVSQRGCPSPCIISINQQGMLFLHPKTQVHLADINLDIISEPLSLTLRCFGARFAFEFTLFSLFSLCWSSGGSVSSSSVRDSVNENSPPEEERKSSRRGY